MGSTAGGAGWSLGEAALNVSAAGEAARCFEAAKAEFDATAADAASSRADVQAAGNLRWTEAHLLFARALEGAPGMADALADAEADWSDVDAEASALAGLFHARCLTHERRRRIKLQDVRARARRHGLGEIARRASRLLAVLGAVALLAGTVAAMLPSPEPTELARGNTGGGSGGQG